MDGQADSNLTSRGNCADVMLVGGSVDCPPIHLVQSESS